MRDSKDKRKRLSESKQGDRRQGISATKPYPHNRSSSMHKEKKELRFNTDYCENDQSHTANFTNYTKFQKKAIPSRRRDTFDIQLSEPPKQMIVQSTKNNPDKNMEIKGLFKREDPLKPQKTRNSIGNHPLLKFIGKKQREKGESPYVKAQRQPSQYSHGNSTSTNKQKTSSLSKKPQQLLLSKDQISLRADAIKEPALKDQQTQKI